MLPLKFCYVYTMMVWVHFMVHFPPLGDAFVTVTSAPDVRLPKSVIPIHYDIELQPYLHDPDPQRFTFKGSVRILIKCVEATDSITLHINGLQVNTTMIRFYSDGSQASSPQYLTYDTDFERQFFIIKLTKNMEENSQYYIEMSFTSPLQKDLTGLYYSEYTRNGQPVYLATTQFQPTHARKAFPCFDEPALKATFNVTLVRPENRISISNMPVIDSSQSFMEDGIKYVKDVFQQTPVMSTYILAFVVSDFEYTQDTTKYDVTIRAWASPETVNQTLFSLDVGVDVMTYFEDYFKIKYPLSKEDMIAVPDFEAGAMENWGLIIYKLNAMLWEPGVSDQVDKESVATVVAHELAHQWFGNLVTPSWWDDIWLNEGFATFGQHAAIDHVLPEWKMFDKFVVDSLQTALEEDGKVSSHPVFVPVGYPEEIKEIFDPISYKKGASIVIMMRHFLGHETFKKAISNYLNRKAYGVTTHDDLWQILTEQASSDGKDVDVKEIMDTWILQMNYPVVTVTRDSGDDGRLRVTQERYLEDPTAIDPGKYESPFGYRWTIPLTFASSADPDFDQDDSGVVWLWKHEESKNIDLTPARLPPQSDQKGWFIANVYQKGFYRVNYQSVNWISLCRQLQEDHKVIPVTNRAQIIDDAWNLFRAGHIGIDIALKTFDYLDNEKDYIPWEAVKGELDYMLSKLSRHSVFGAFQNAMQDKLYAPYRYFGLNNTGDSHTEILTRAIVAGQACSYGIRHCRDSSSVLYKDWMDNPKVNPIDPDLKSFVYCNAIRNGGWSEFYFGLKKFREVNPANQNLRLFLIAAMSCSEKSFILNFYLDLIFREDSPFTVLESIVLLAEVATKSVGRPLAWNFFRANYDKLQELYYMYGTAIPVVIESVAGVLDSESELNELLAFKASRKESEDSVEEALDKAVEKVKSNIKWLETNVPHIEQWLTDAGYA